MPRNRVYELLERLANLLRAEERAAGADLGLQPVHLHALAYLARCNRYSDTPAAVAEYLGSTKGTVSQTLAVLQEKELVAAATGEQDRRKVHLRLTARGRRAVERLLPPPLLGEALDAMGPAAADQLEAELTALLVGMQRARGQRLFGVCRTCRHCEVDGNAFRCGLTKEALRADETQRICREHEAKR